MDPEVAPLLRLDGAEVPDAAQPFRCITLGLSVVCRGGRRGFGLRHRRSGAPLRTEVDPVLRPARGGVKLWCSQAGLVIC